MELPTPRPNRPHIPGATPPLAHLDEEELVLLLYRRRPPRAQRPARRRPPLALLLLLLLLIVLLLLLLLLLRARRRALLPPAGPLTLGLLLRAMPWPPLRVRVKGVLHLQATTARRGGCAR